MQFSRKIWRRMRINLHYETEIAAQALNKFDSLQKNTIYIKLQRVQLIELQQMNRSQSGRTLYVIPGLDMFPNVEYVGRGSFGTVYKGKDKKGHEYAVKAIKTSGVRISNELLNNQINVLKKLNHQNVVKFYQVVYTTFYAFILMELCQSDLETQIKLKKAQKCLFTQNQAIAILTQMAKAVNFIHDKNIVHRDLKPANILKNKSQYKIADFGVARLVFQKSQMLQTYAGTVQYMSPQILEGAPYTSKCDVWSLGVIFYELLFGNLPWVSNSRNQRQLAEIIKNNPITYLYGISEKAKRLVIGMLQVDEQKRLSTKQLLNYLETEQISSLQKTFHHSTMEKLFMLQLNRLSKMIFKVDYKNLGENDRNVIIQSASSSFNNEGLQIFNYFVLKELSQ